MKEDQHARRAALDYTEAIRRIEGAETVHYAPPLRGQRAYYNSVWLSGLCKARGLPLEKYFENVLDLYSKDWMLKVFGRPWLPFSVAVSEKTWKKFNKSSSNADGLAKELADAREILKGYPPDMRLALLEHSQGWLSGEAREVLNG